MLTPEVVAEAQRYLVENQLSGWLIHSYHHSNPVFTELVGGQAMLTRPCFLYIPTQGTAFLVAHHVDAGRLSHASAPIKVYRDRDSMIALLQELLSDGASVAMEYSPQGEIPRASRVDAGTLELVRGLGAEVVSSADLLQYATQRWSPAQLESHQRAADKLGEIVLEAFHRVGQQLFQGPTEHQVAQFILDRFGQQGLTTDHGPIVATNDHASDPHFEPMPERSRPIKAGDWLLIDLWAREDGPYSIYADITWVAYVGDSVPARHMEVFRAVTGARDAALKYLQQCHQQEVQSQGWQVDQVARKYITSAGYGDYFTHRLGHSLGREVHGEAVNLDGFETHDTRTIIPGIGFTIEPGIYLPDLGMRSEINVFMKESGPVVTSTVQKDVVLIKPS